MINYEPIERISKSSQGAVVLKVKNKDTNEICVLKLIGQLSNNLNKLIFKREVGALRILNQFDDIVKIYDSSDKISYNKQSGYGAILLELLPGQSLNKINFISFTELEKLIICRNIAVAVSHAHQCGVLHRDIKPSNIMLIDEVSKIKVIDFGCSKLKTVVDEETTKWIVSPGYTAPEVIQVQESTEKSDIYSLGAVFSYIFFAKPETDTNFLESSNLLPEFQKLLINMLAKSPNDRIDDTQAVVIKLDEIINVLNYNANNFWFTIDSEKHRNLQRRCIIENSMTFQQFMSVYLPKEFSTMYGIYNKRDKNYEFIGNNLYMACSYNETNRVFEVVKLYEILVDRRSKLQRIFGVVDGRVSFSGFGKQSTWKNNSNILKTILHNYADERDTYESKNKLFEELFGKWRESILESFESLKDKCIQVKYSDYEFDNNKLFIYVESIKNIEIDELSMDTHFIFDVPQNPREKCVPIGNLEDVIFEQDKSALVIGLDRGVSSGKLRPYLEVKSVIMEDYGKKSVALKRQLSAITTLKNDEYNSIGLKDIILELATPTSTYSIQSMMLYNKQLNITQQQAVKKALFSNNISLIQGPPGTGKTSVISEIILQILKKTESSDIPPKILVVSQSNTAVDNILEGLASWSDIQKIRIIRIGDKAKVSKDVASKYLIDAIKDNLFSDVHSSSTAYVNNQLEIYRPIDSDDNHSASLKLSNYKTWKSIEEIHEDWLKRCGDYSSLHYHIVNSATIIAGTCVGFLSDNNVRDMSFDYVIVDEAAKATTPELLVSIVKAEKIILVGDQNQLAPFADGSLSGLTALLVKDPKYRLFDILFDSLPDTHKEFLSVQYRMHKVIGNLISNIFYEGKVLTGIEDDKRIHSIEAFIGSSIIWIDTSRLDKHECHKGTGGSYYNIAEINVIRKLLEQMNCQDNANDLDVGIITGYRAQKESILKAYKNGDYKDIGVVDINTLDAFQGRQNDIIIYSTVRTEGSIGFQQEKERINVAFSRAKCLLIVCGDLEFFESWSGAENKFIEIIQYIRENPDGCRIINGREIFS